MPDALNHSIADNGKRIFWRNNCAFKPEHSPRQDKSLRAILINDKKEYILVLCVYAI